MPSARALARRLAPLVLIAGVVVVAGLFSRDELVQCEIRFVADEVPAELRGMSATLVAPGEDAPLGSFRAALERRTPGRVLGRWPLRVLPGRYELVIGLERATEVRTARRSIEIADDGATIDVELTP